MSSIRKLFRAHGGFCSSHPWEVIVGTLTASACLLSLEHHVSELPRQSHHPCLSEPERNATDMITMTTIRCVSVLYSYYQFVALQRTGSRYIVAIAALFTIFSSFAFTSALLTAFESRASDLKDALFFFILMTDVSKIATLAQFAVSSSNQNDIKDNISKGMASLGPAITLDTVVEVLVIGTGTLSGVSRLETLCFYACVSVVVNYIVFMTLYPACLALILELSKSSDYAVLYNDVSRSLKKTLREETQKPNQVVQRIKLIMSAGLMLVHAHSRSWFTSKIDDDIIVASPLNRTDVVSANALYGSALRWLTTSADQIVILILLIALAVKFLLFETTNDDRDIVIGDVCNVGVADFRLKYDVAVQTTEYESDESDVDTSQKNVIKFHIDEMNTIIKKIEVDPKFTCDEKECDINLTDDKLISLVLSKHIPFHQIEQHAGNRTRGVAIRRAVVENLTGVRMTELPYVDYDYASVEGRCCENVIGYVPVPVGVAGPLLLDGIAVHVPMATTEGCLVASTNRGCRATFENGITSRVVSDGMSRGPVVRFRSLKRSSEVLKWLGDSTNFNIIKSIFDSTSRFARLKKVSVRIAGRYLFIRFVATTGDAMGMNMLSKGTEKVLNELHEKYFTDMEVLSLSGNYCSDKKPAAVNWIEGRGKSVVCEAIISSATVEKILKTTINALVDLNISKNLIGSAVAGSVGGYNAHAANVVTAIFIATGQDPAQNVTSSNCMTLMEPWGTNDLYVSCTMPSIEIGTVGGGTALQAQSACLDLLGVKGSSSILEGCIGDNANRLAKIVCATVLAGELSLMAALCAGHLVESHLSLNRSTNSVVEKKENQ